MHKKLFSATNIVKGSDNEKHVYSNYGVSFDGTGEGKYLVIVIFGSDDSLSFHTDNHKNDFQYQMKEILLVLMVALMHQFSINFTKAKTKLCLSLYYNGDNSYLFINRKKYKIKANKKMSTFHPNFVQEAYLIYLIVLRQKTL